MEFCSQGVVWWSSVVRGLSGGVLYSGSCLVEFCSQGIVWWTSVVRGLSGGVL